MAVKQGEIYFDPKYKYPLGNEDDKFLIVLNKSYLPQQPIILVPVTTDKKNKYKKGCNHRSYIYRIEANEDFFVENTLVQLDLVNHPYREELFADKMKNHGLKFTSCLASQTITAIMKCLKELKEDVNTELHSYLF